MKISVKEIVESGMLIALAIILDLPFLKIRIGEGGGSISFTMIPLFILCLRMGPLKGFISVGLVYGFLTCLFDGWGLIYLPFDYILGYGSLAIIGFFKNNILKDKVTIKGILFIVVGIIISLIFRIIFACLSSIIFYEFTLVEAVIYNLAYVGPSGVLSLVVIIGLYKPLIMINKRFPTKSIDNAL